MWIPGFFSLSFCACSEESWGGCFSELVPCPVWVYKLEWSAKELWVLEGEAVSEIQHRACAVLSHLLPFSWLLECSSTPTRLCLAFTHNLMCLSKLSLSKCLVCIYQAVRDPGESCKVNTHQSTHSNCDLNPAAASSPSRVWSSQLPSAVLSKYCRINPNTIFMCLMLWDQGFSEAIGLKWALKVESLPFHADVPGEGRSLEEAWRCVSKQGGTWERLDVAEEQTWGGWKG